MLRFSDSKQVSDKDKATPHFQLVDAKINTNGKMISGIAMLEYTLYVVTEESNEIISYNITKVKSVLPNESSVKIEGMRKPDDMASWKSKMCSYIAEQTAKRVWKI